MKTIQIETKRLIIRPFKASDHQSWKQGLMQRKPPQSNYDSGPVPAANVTASIYKKYRDSFKRVAAADHAYVFGVFRKKDGAVLGTVDFQTYSRDERDWANVGYFIHNQFQGHGYASEALVATIKLGFDALGYHRIEAATRLDNKPSIAVAKKAGLVRECIRKKFWIDQGAWADHVIYVAIKDLWQKP